MKKAIAMLCTQEQFDAVKPKLKGYEINDIGSFVTHPYLTNNLHGRKGVISNIWEKSKTQCNREVHEEWNEKVFLEACGIETETVLEVGKWYKGTYADNSDKVNHSVWCHTKTNNGRVFAYGLDYKGIWHNESEFTTLPIIHVRQATQKEVFEALKNEAVKRGYKEGTIIDAIYSEGNLKLGVGEPKYYNDDNSFYTNGFIVFKSGKWATIIEHPKEEKKPRPNRLDELEKRVRILELKVDSKKIAEMPENPYKSLFDTYPLKDIENGVVDAAWLGKEVHELKNPNFGIKVPEYLKHLENVKFGIDFGGDYHEISKPVNFNNEIPKYRPANFHEGWVRKIEKAFNAVDTNPHSEVNKLKLRIEELEAENKVILGGGQSKLEKENEELKNEVAYLKEALDKTIHTLEDDISMHLREKVVLKTIIENIIKVYK